jgi:hypothetical protein
MKVMSKEALEAVEAIRRDLKIEIDADIRGRIYDMNGHLKVSVRLKLAGETISEQDAYVNLPA